MSQGTRDFGTGPLSEVTTVIYWFLVTGVLFVLVTAPGTIPMLFLERHISNAPLYVLFMLPVGPALAALLFALEQRREADSVTPAAHFFRGYRLNWVAALKLWVPGTLLVGILAINLANAAATGFGTWYPTVAVLLGLVVIGLLLLGIVIISLFSFRTRDVVRLAAGYLFSRPIVLLGVVGLVVISVIVVTITFDAVLILLASLFAAALLRVTRPVQDDIRLNYLTPSSDDPKGS